MAADSILKLTLRVLSLPFFFTSYVIERLDLWGLKSDLTRCLHIVDAAEIIPESFVLTLIAAEDHRSAFHPGIDPIAIMRALAIQLTTGRLQGASTIEQQLVRVATGYYARTMRRKFREQMLAAALSRQRSKSKIAAAYLSIAFYGSHKYGITALRDACAGSLEKASQETVSSMIARLKYPEPLYPSSNWHLKIARRVNYISKRLDHSTKYTKMNSRKQVESDPSAKIEYLSHSKMEVGLLAMNRRDFLAAVGAFATELALAFNHAGLIHGQKVPGAKPLPSGLDEAIFAITALPEVQEFQSEVLRLSGGMVNIKVCIESTPDLGAPVGFPGRCWSIAIAEDYLTHIVTTYRFSIDVDSGQIWHHNVIDNHLVAYDEWSRQFE
ncbi:MAG: biosynthetic peptidoglycan transglycosylase [Sulfuriferula sp.]